MLIDINSKEDEVCRVLSDGKPLAHGAILFSLLIRTK